MSYIFNVFKEFKLPLMLIYLYTLVAQLLFLVEPFLLGKAIDGVLAGSYIFLCILLFVYVIQNIFMYKRMVYDTKVYTTIYNKIIFQYLKTDQNSHASTKIARTDMAHNVINFLENDIQYFIMSIMSLVGTLFFIFMQDVATGFVVAIGIIPVVFIVKMLYSKIAQATKVGFNQYERKIDILTKGDRSEIDTFFLRRRKIMISGSTLQGKNWFALNTSKSIFLILALIVFTSGKTTLTQGQTVSMFSYLNQFLISLLSIPIGVETITRIKDVIGRIKAPY